MTDASDKLARTRLAIIEFVHERQHGSPAQQAREARLEAKQEQGEQQVKQEVRVAAGAASSAYDRARARGKGWYGSVKRAAGAWWRHHPAHLGVELATPVLSTFAARRPVVYLTAAAALGALAVVTRPWRVVSVTGVVVALLKSSQISSMVLSAMSGADYAEDPRPYR